MPMTPSNDTHPRAEPQMFQAEARHKPDGAQNPAGEVGWFLQRERENRGLSLEEAGEATGIHPYHIEAIEFGDLTHMPPRLEATEMIAGYAQFLGFDAEPLISHLLSFLPPPPVARKKFHPASPPVLSSAKVLSFAGVGNLGFMMALFRRRASGLANPVFKQRRARCPCVGAHKAGRGPCKPC